ncbi:MAG TPA: alpha-amylase/4-alpha-glucanotransferase domain-containing protein [Anaerolineae bacterium]|nr:alpha-amylase/4-alpha-glucanotransferase domain-containing protein [Anaerolineae bacterium]
MTNTLNLALVFHNHQPVGNFDFVFEEAYLRAYEPLIAALERHPGVRATLHWSGPLRDWLQAHRPELLRRARALVERGQVEPLGGGYYEPVLVALPDADKIGQLLKLNAAVQQDFGVRPSGAWLVERVWELHLPRFLAEAGLEYTLVDDTHFTSAGFTPEELYGYYVTEEQGYRQKLFISSQFLRNSMPWSPIEHVLNWLRELAGQPLPPGAPSRLVAVGDDGEKFGLWPATHTLCWGDGKQPGWVESFFSALERNAAWLTLLTLGEAARTLSPLGRAYLPASSYEEMTEWSLPASRARELAELKRQLQAAGRTDILRYVKGGAWRSFMVKYPEVNTLHKKIIFASAKVHRIPDAELRAAALDRLWASQCDCPFWHGVFGGVYLFHIREAAAENLIEAELIADHALHAEETWAEVILQDIDCDGFDEAMLSSETQQLMVSPGQGGSVIAWDWRATMVNLLNVLSRRPEAYHASLVEAAANGTLNVAGQPVRLDGSQQTQIRAKEEGLEQKLIYDWYRRASLIDHIFAPAATLDAFYRSTLEELGDFVNQPYTVQTSESRGEVVLALARDGGIYQDGARLPLRVEKKIKLRSGDSSLLVDYAVTNTGDQPVSIRFGIETNWGMSGGNSSEGAYIVWPGGTLKRLNVINKTIDVAEAAIVHEDIGRIVVRASAAGTWWQFPIETVSNSEAGFERVYQGTTLMAHWPLELKPGEVWKLSMTFVLIPSSD